jgi:hypothetical protein
MRTKSVREWQFCLAFVMSVKVLSNRLKYTVPTTASEDLKVVGMFSLTRFGSLDDFIIFESL